VHITVFLLYVGVKAGLLFCGCIPNKSKGKVQPKTGHEGPEGE